MGYWGWRPLLGTLFICVLITGCTITNATAPVVSPTMLPRITLTLRLSPSGTPTAPPTAPATATDSPAAALSATPNPDSAYVVRPGDTLLGIALDFGLTVDELRAANAGIDPLALQVGQIISIPPLRTAIAAGPTPVPLTVEPPDCQYMITGGLLCLGQVHNPHDQPVNNARIALQLLDVNNVPLHQITIRLEPMHIPPHADAPYSAILPGQDYDRVVVQLLSAQLVTTPADSAPLDIVAEEAQVDQNRYQVTVTLRNASDQRTGSARVILTVVDADGRVVGLRVVNSPAGFEPGAEQTLHIEALTRAADGPLRHTIYVETQPGG